MTFALRNFWTIVFGCLIGTLVVLTMPALMDAIEKAYDRSNPVWQKTTAQVISRDGYAVRIHVKGTKARDCRFLRVWAQAGYDSLSATDAVVTRPDPTYPIRKTRPTGEQDLGEFIVAPIPPDATNVVVHIEHDCGDRIVVGRLVRVEL